MFKRRYIILKCVLWRVCRKSKFNQTSTSTKKIGAKREEMRIIQFRKDVFKKIVKEGNNDEIIIHLRKKVYKHS